MARSSGNQAGVDGTMVVQCGRLIDGTGGSPREEVSLVIEGGVIRQVIPTSALQAQGTERLPPVVDATAATVLPGLMDLHLHLASVVDPDEANAMLAMMGADPPMTTLHGARNARVMLEAGFTTVRDVAGYTNFSGAEMVALRRAIEIGLVPGPRLFVAGWVSQTLGHLDMGRPLTWPRMEGYVADGPWEVRRKVREFVRGGVDLIKTSASGGRSPNEEPWFRNYTFEEHQALCDEAHAYGRRVAVHVHTPEAMTQVLMAGADTLEHASELDDQVIELIVKKGAFIVPTLFYRSPRGLASRIAGGAHPEMVAKHRALVERGFEAVGRAHRAGVKIACGTDTYRALRSWGEQAYELECLVMSGMTPMEAIVAATRVSAEALGKEKELGTLEAGKAADLLVFDGDPLEDVRVLQERERIKLVVKAGRIVVDRRAPGERLEGVLPWRGQ